MGRMAEYAAEQQNESGIHDTYHSCHPLSVKVSHERMDEQYADFLIHEKKIYGTDLDIAIKQGKFWDEFVAS